MSDSIRTEQDRRITELEALVGGLSAEVVRLTDLVERGERQMLMVILTLGNLAQRLKKGT